MLSEDRIVALTRLFQGRYGYVYAVASRYAPNSEQIEDIVQEVYIDFVLGDAEKKWDLSRNIDPLLYQIAKRKAQLLWREKCRKVTLLSNVAAERLIASVDTDAEEQEECERNEARLQALRQCLEMLTPKCRAVIEQHYFQGIDIKVIGEQLEIKESTIYHFFCRIRSKLRECIQRKIETF